MDPGLLFPRSISALLPDMELALWQVSSRGLTAILLYSAAGSELDLHP